ncbi:MAG: LysR family transcriptional regulator [Rubrivivax sp.]|nr:LysR family transcriptional regulator [Rubrivivax sp.]MBK7264223.1 LysR family transcriptional regulator [Rubrivivax sp.]MBK8527733.1 LysR family transcriptional regulator [Rubrivivax sp.]
MNHLRHRPLGVGPLRAFEAVARLSSFSAAGVELHLTQPAISRQIRSLEDEVGATLLLRGTRHVELTSAGAALLRAVAPWLDRLDASVRQIRSQGARRRISVTTFASFASLWLIPRLQDFQRQHPGIDIRVSADDTLADPDDPEIDLALRYTHADHVPADTLPLFGEVLTPVVNPALGESLGRRWTSADLAQQTLLEEDDHRPSAEYLSWRHWLRLHAAPGLEPQGWIYLNYTYQQIQAALAGQGVALARVALVHETLARGELVEPFGPEGRIESPFGYWLLRWPGRQPSPELQAFEDWVQAQAAQTRAAMAAA